MAAAGFSSISTALNALSLHGACTAVFVAVAAVIGFLTGSIRTLGKISWLAWAGVISIITALLTLTIAVGLQDRPAAAPQDGPFVSDYKLIGNPTFIEAMSALNTFVFAYAGTPAFFAIMSEMRDPRDYNKAMYICQGTMTAIYIIVGVVVYYFCGSYVASPALGSAGPLLKRVCYGLAITGLIASTCLVTHYPAKYVFLRIMKGSKHLVSNSKTHWTTFMSMQPLGAMWLYDNLKRPNKGTKWVIGVVWASFVILIGTFIMVAGSYSAIVGIIDDYNSGTSGAWSCADNSNSGSSGH